MKRLSFFIFLIFFGNELFGQSVKRVGTEVGYGFIIPHSPELKPFANNRPFGINTHVQWMGLAEKNWKACKCFHYLGLMLSYHNFNDRQVLGSATSLSATFEPIIWKKSNWTLSVLSGMGISYLNRVFDEVENPDNVFISSTLSFLLFLSPKFEYRISPQFGATSSFVYNHISNGGRSQPNKGINYPIVNFGVNYYLHTFDYPLFERQETVKNPFFYTEVGYTNRKVEGEERRAPSISLVLGVVKPFTPINGLGAGIELNKDFSLPVENNRLEALMPAPFVAHHFIFGRFDFSQRIGIYTQKPIGYVDNLFYQRYVIKYKFYEEFSMGISLKAHGHVAENIDFRIGWAF